ncbi:MAG: hypothetical protein JWL68_2833 [Actinomycetia bacterium]|nr:hypothetical protein [Actinomycetes bacterium]
MIGRKLQARGADLAYHDPYVAEWPLRGESVRRADDLDRIARIARLLLDTRGRIAGPNAAALLIRRTPGRSAAHLGGLRYAHGAENDRKPVTLGEDFLDHGNLR